MKRVILIAVALSVGCAVAGWRGRFDEQFAAALNAGTPIPAVAWYKLDGNALDSSGNGYHGEWRGTEAYSNSAAFFNGVSRIRGIPASADDAPFTLCAWVRYTNATIPSGGGYALHNGTLAAPGSGSGYLIRQLSDGTLEAVGHDTARVRKTISIPNNIGDSIHLAVVFDGSAFIAYKNGIESGRAACIGFYGSGAGVIGGDVGLFRTWTGTIGDVRIYNRALSEANIARIMESQDNDPLEELQ